MKKVNFKASGQKITGTFFSPPKPKPKNPAILFIHGWASSGKRYTPEAQTLAKIGACCLVFNLRGHKESEGKLENLSKADHLKDAITAYDFLIKQKNVDKEKIGVIGISYSGYLTPMLTLKRKVKWLVLRVPTLYMNDDFHTPSAKVDIYATRKYRQTKIKAKNNLALKALSQFKNNVLIVQSGKDKHIPEQTIKNYKNAINPQAKFTFINMKEASHSLSDNKSKQEFTKILSDWFSRSGLKN